MALGLAALALILIFSSGVLAQSTTDYDTDDDHLIEVDSLAKLNAIRFDLDGDGSVDTGTSTDDTAVYEAAFLNPAATMGCASGDHDDDSTTDD